MHQRRNICKVCTAAALFAGLLGTGCQLGPAALKIGHARYSDAVQRTAAEQLLLNLVRLRYREAPVFLEVGSISAQFVFDQSGSLSGTLNENIGAQRGNPDSLSLSGRVGYAERPTITYSPLKGDDFVKRMLAPIGIEHVVLLTQSGWKVDRVLRLTLQGMNGLDNASAASGPTPAVAPPFRRFLEAAALLGRLKRDARVRFEYQTRVAEVSDLLPAKLITADALVEANKAGARFRETDNGRAYVLTRDQRQLVLRVAGDAVASPETARLRQLLRLAPDRSQYPLIPAAAGGASPGGPEVPRERLAWDCRSLLGVMFYLSQGVRVPAAHLRSGIVTDTRDADGGPFDWSSVLGDLFDVHVRRLPPTDAAVAIRHRGYWFYIRDDDLTTKSTFALLDQLFTLQAGSAKSAAPVLTLPVGG